MKTHKLFSTLGLILALFCGTAQAAPAIDSLNVQAYMKKANNTAVTDGTYDITFGVRQNGVFLWARQYSVTVTNGLFSQTLSGAGTDESAIPAGTGMNADFTGATLGPALLMAGGAGAVTIRVYAVDTIDGTNPQFDLTISSVPTAFVAETAKGVAAGSVGVAGLNTADTSDVGGGAFAGDIVLLDAGGLLDPSLFPAPGDFGAAAAGANTDITSVNPTGGLTVGGGATTSVVISSGSGTVSVGGAGNSGVDISSGSGTVTVGGASNTGVDVGGTGLTTLNLGSAATGALTTTIGGNVGASASTLRSGTGGVTISSTGTTASAIAMNVTGVNGGIALSTNGTGIVSANSQVAAKGFIGGVQAVATAAAAVTFAADGSSLIEVTPAGAATIATITGCNSGVVGQGQEVVVRVAAWTVGAFAIVDTANATATADSIMLAGNTNYSMTTSAATRGSILKIMCITHLGTRKWVEISRTANTN